MLAVLIILCVALPVSAADTLTDDAPGVANNEPSGDPDGENHLGWEWFGVELGTPLLRWTKKDYLTPGNFFCADVLFPIYRWKHAYIATIEMHVGVVFADFGVSTGGGYRLALGDTLDYEMRFGATFGYRTQEFGHGDALAPSPHIQLITNFKHASIGLGLELPLYFYLAEYNEPEGFFGNGEPGRMFEMELYLYFRVTVL